MTEHRTVGGGDAEEGSGRVAVLGDQECGGEQAREIADVVDGVVDAEDAAAVGVFDAALNARVHCDLDALGGDVHQQDGDGEHDRFHGSGEGGDDDRAQGHEEEDPVAGPPGAGGAGGGEGGGEHADVPEDGEHEQPGDGGGAGRIGLDVPEEPHEQGDRDDEHDPVQEPVQPLDGHHQGGAAAAAEVLEALPHAFGGGGDALPQAPAGGLFVGAEVGAAEGGGDEERRDEVAAAGGEGEHRVGDARVEEFRDAGGGEAEAVGERAEGGGERVRGDEVAGGHDLGVGGGEAGEDEPVGGQDEHRAQHPCPVEAGDEGEADDDHEGGAGEVGAADEVAAAEPVEDGADVGAEERVGAEEDRDGGGVPERVVRLAQVGVEEHRERERRLEHAVRGLRGEPHSQQVPEAAVAGEVADVPVGAHRPRITPVHAKGDPVLRHGIPLAAVLVTRPR
jgi:hypothetical protein